MAFFTDLLAGQMRKELKNRTQEILEATNQLKKAMADNTQSLKKVLGTADPTVVCEFKISLQEIRDEEKNLIKAVTEHITILEEILKKIR